MKFSPYARHLLETRYLQEGEKTWEDLVHRVACHAAPENEKRRQWYFDIISRGDFLPSRMPYMGTEYPFCSSCFVLGPIEDSRVSIFSVLTDMAEVQSRGGGTGYNFSRLRPEGALISTTRGRASGPCSFMQLYNAVTKCITRNGNKGGAQMGVLRVDHPDIVKFIHLKDKETDMVNFNISVAITDDFIEAVKDDGPWELVFNGRVYEHMRARWLFDEIARHAWGNGEPGVIFIDTVNKNNPFDEPIEACNPCWTGDTKIWTVYGPQSFSELAAAGEDVPVFTQDEDRTLCVRMMRNIRPTKRDASLVRITLDDGSVLRCTPEHNIYLRDGRKIMALQLTSGDSISSLHGYDSLTNDADGPRVVSVEPCDETEDVYNGTVDETHRYFAMYGEKSAILSANCGEMMMPNNFSCNLGSVNLSGVDPDSEGGLRDFETAVRAGIYFLNDSLNHAWFPLDKVRENTIRCRNIGLGVMGFADYLIRNGVPYDSDEAVMIAENISLMLRTFADRAADDYAREHRTRRNMTVTSIAPTGSIATLAGCSYSIEPIFGVTFVKNTALGQSKEVSPDFERIAKERGFYSDALMKQVVDTGSVQSLDAVPDDIKALFKTANEIPWQRHVQMQAAWQKHLENAASKTINLPNSATVEDVKGAFMMAYDLGCKSTTVYRDQSRAVQAVTVGTGQEVKSLAEIGLKMHVPIAEEGIVCTECTL